MILALGILSAGLLGVAAGLLWRAGQIEQRLEHWRHEAGLYMTRARQFEGERDRWRERAEDYERIAKTFEEHIAAERARGDRLAEALRESEDRRENALGQQAAVERQLAELRLVRPEMDVDAREFANILNYNGTGEGQVRLNDR